MQGYSLRNRFHVAVFVFAAFLFCGGLLPAQEKITKKASWQPAPAQEISAAFEKWITDTRVDDEVAKRLRDWLKANPVDSPEPLDSIVEALSIADSNVDRVRERLQSLQVGESKQLPKSELASVLENESTAPFVKNHVRLLYGRWLARQKLFDEALVELEKIDMDTVLDRVTLLYHRGLMQHQLLKSRDCIGTLSKLLENEDSLPRRYTVLSRMMLADMQQLEKDSLDEISRLMNDVRRRTSLFRSGKRVRDQESEVIEKLDKLIKELEEKQRQMQMAQQNVQPTNPLDRLQRIGGKGSGEVKSKRQVDGGQWGDMNPTQREAALAEMARDLPPHYRSVVEEYFRKLAEENEK